MRSLQSFRQFIASAAGKQKRIENLGPSNICLQAHLAGHKHKVRCFKRGLDPCAALITPTSTPPSTAPSECSAPRSSVSSKYHTFASSPSAGAKSSLLGNPPLKQPLMNKQKPGLLGEYPASAAASAINALRGLLPLPLPKTTTPSTVSCKSSLRSANLSQNAKLKTRKQPRKAAKERRDSTTESDEPTGTKHNSSKN